MAATLRSLAIACALLPLLGGTGCVAGLVYHHVTVPLDVNLDVTPIQAETARNESWKTFRYYYLQVDWGSAGIADAARKEGLTKIHYADLETLRVLGIWTQRWAVVYGE